MNLEHFKSECVEEIIENLEIDERYKVYIDREKFGRDYCANYQRIFIAGNLYFY